jgi:hypothetical protein
LSNGYIDINITFEVLYHIVDHVEVGHEDVCDVHLSSRGGYMLYVSFIDTDNINMLRGQNGVT